MASITGSADSNESGNQSDCKSPSKEICAHSAARSTQCFLCPLWSLLPIKGINSESTRSPLDRFGLTSSEKNPTLGMLTSHFAAAFRQLELLGPESSLSARLDDFEKLSDDHLQSGTVFLRKSRAMAGGNGSRITEIRLSWEKGKPDEESDVWSLTTSDALNYDNNLANHVNFSGPIQPFKVSYKLAIESYADHIDDTSHTVHHGSALNEVAAKINGDLYHLNSGMEPISYWTICSSRSSSWTHQLSSVPKCRMDIPVSYNYGFCGDETVLCVVTRISMCTAFIFRLSLQVLDHSPLEGSVSYGGSQFGVSTQTSISHSKLFLRADCRDAIKEEGIIKDECISNQQRRPGIAKTTMNIRECPAAQKNPGTSPSQSGRKPVKRRKDPEELDTDQLGGQTTSGDISTKRVRGSDDTGGLACPFYKMNPWKFDRCLSYKLSKMSYVKQHLLRYHDAPYCNCPICQHPLSKEVKEDSQTGSQDCQKTQCTLYTMTAQQKRDIQRATGRKITREGKWYQVWSILFPGAKKPDSPFVKGHNFTEVLSSFHTFYHNSGSHIIEETFRQVIESSRTYHEAFDTLLKKIEHQALTQSVGLGSSFHFGSSIETEAADEPVVLKSPSATNISRDNKEPVLLSSIRGDHDSIPLSGPPIMRDNKQEAFALGNSSGTLSYNPKAQETLTDHNGADEIESHEMVFGSPGASHFHQMYWPTPYQETSLISAEPQDMINYDDNTIDICPMGAIFNFTYSPGSPTAAYNVNIGTEISDWVAD